MIKSAEVPEDFRAPPPPGQWYDRLSQDVRRRQIYALNKQMKAVDDFRWGIYSKQQNTRMIAHCLPSFLGHAVGLVLTCWWLLWSDQATVASGQCLTHSHDGRFSITLKNDGILGPPGWPQDLSSWCMS